MNITHHEVTIVHKQWEDVGKETYCDNPQCDECRVIDKATQGTGHSQYWTLPSNPMKARVREVITIDSPKQYRVWIIEIFRDRFIQPGRYGGARVPQYFVETVVEHWSTLKEKWVNH